MQIKFKSLSSGSCGNCYFLGIFGDDGRCEAGVQIDAGISPRRFKKEMASMNISHDQVDAILVTHDHMDHIRSLGSYCKHTPKAVWATSVLHQALAHHPATYMWIGGCSRKLKDNDWSEIVPGRIKARYFVVPHDASQTVGYAIMLDNFKFVIMTDLGRMTDEALNWARQADAVVIESNYDMYMLRHGPYPRELQDRICQGNGHLSNNECAEAIKSFWHEGLKHIFLCHLSEHNNTPELALEASSQALRHIEAFDSTRLIALPRQTPSPCFQLYERILESN